MKRNLSSVLALGVFLTLAFGSSQDFADGFEEGWDEGWEEYEAAGEGTWGPSGNVETTIFELGDLKGRQVWMVNGPKSDCAKLEKLGMIVECDQGYDTLGMEHEIVIWCEAFDHGIAQKMLDHLGHSEFSVRTHQTYPPGTDNSECGELYEVTIRYEDAGS